MPVVLFPSRVILSRPGSGPQLDLEAHLWPISSPGRLMTDLPLLPLSLLLLTHHLLLLLQLPLLLLPPVLEPHLDLLLRDLCQQGQLLLPLAVDVLVATEVRL